MSRSSVVRGSCAVLFLVMSAAAFGQGYETLVSFSDIQGDSQMIYIGAHCFEGTTGYFILRGKVSIDPDPLEFGTEFIKVANIGGTTARTVLVPSAAWKAFTGGVDGNSLPGNRMMIRGDYLQFLDEMSDAIYRIHKTTGTPSVFVSNAAIKAVTGRASATLIDACDFSPCGDMAFYDQVSDSILVADPDGNVSVLVSSADFQTAYGCPAPPSNYNFVAGGMAYDTYGNLYWTLTNTGSTCGGGSVYKRQASDGTISRVLTEADIRAKTTSNPLAVAFNDIFAAPDGNVYFYDRRGTVDSILYFSPVDPANTLAIFISEAQIQAGPAGSAEVNISALNAYGSKLTWHHIDGYYSVYAKTLVESAKAASDVDKDGDVDLADFSHFQACFNGPNRPAAAAGCCDMDFDKDRDVDLTDFGVFQACFNGPNRPPACQ